MVETQEEILILISSLFGVFSFLQKIVVKNEAVAVSDFIKGKIMKGTAQQEKNVCLLSGLWLLNAGVFEYCYSNNGSLE